MSTRISGPNARTGIVLAGVAVVMIGLSFAAVPLYFVFRQATGYAGTTQIAAAAPGPAGARLFDVRFNADVDPRLAWAFQPPRHGVRLRAGEKGVALYRARNLAERPMIAAATFNVTPLKAGIYFNQIECFCFDEQRLEPGQEADMAVSFFVDPAILDDRNLEEVKTITLSYTFFPRPGADARPTNAAVN